MDARGQRYQTSLLRVTRTTGGATGNRQTIWLLGVEHTLTAVQTHGFRAVLHRAAEIASAMPWCREVYNLARNAAQDVTADGETLRKHLEHVMVLAHHKQAKKVFDLARGELSATYCLPDTARI